MEPSIADMGASRRSFGRCVLLLVGQRGRRFAAATTAWNEEIFREMVFKSPFCSDLIALGMYTLWSDSIFSIPSLSF